MEWLKIIGIALVTSFFALFLRKNHKEYAMLLSLAGGTVILLQLLLSSIPLFSQIEAWMSRADLQHSEISVLMRSLGVCILTQFAVDSCKDAGESALASKVELAGKIAVLLIALPLFQTAANLALSLTGGAS